ncbi:uncharacterized protein LOC129732984 [Wyeomyia smithii]|uniref:uncharacterized protein LOC129732984 n=1 Tax=Wyeomyia smithii TaxID=174621 RepID=UPI00246813AD|nr:uncharacterized protein LOC129732984 [Wyeomyia smithii]
MPYKIVQTIEAGEACLSVVPSKWEANGILYWPKKHLVAKLSLEEESAPTDKWETFNCIKKREFTSHAEACNEMQKMEEKSDTEMETESLPVQKVRRRADKNIYFNKLDFNAIAEQQSVKQIAVNSSEPEVYLDTEHEMFINTNQEQMQLTKESQSNDSTSHIIYVEPSNIIGSMEPTDLMATVIANQNLLLGNQNRIMQSLAKMITQVEYLLQASNEREFRHDEHIQINMENGFDPVNSLDDLDKLEDSLRRQHHGEVYSQHEFRLWNEQKVQWVRLLL